MNKKHDIRLAKKIAKSRGGVCLSTKYINNKEKLQWKCCDGHIWESSLGHVKNNNSWCPTCGIKNGKSKRKLPNALKIARDIAKKRNGKCLSFEYINIDTRLYWQCNLGHKWEDRGKNLRGKN